MINKKVIVIGAGLAGCEVCYKLANNNIPVTLYEMKPEKYSPAHKSQNFAELVCSNSLKAMRLGSAAGMLKAEMKILDSIILKAAEHSQVEAGGALAVDRDIFSKYITDLINSNTLISVKNSEVESINNLLSDENNIIVIATGPLTSNNLSKNIQEIVGSESLSFYDAAAPIIKFDTIDMDKAFFGARYNKGNDDYINVPMEKDEYELFYNQLVNAKAVELKEFEKQDFKVYEGCMPIEVMAKRGIDTIRFGPLKPVGLYNPKNDKRPYAVVQLRKENKEGSLYNIVGFQTNLTFGEQKRVFSLLPALANAEFVRYGVMHRNTFINSPKLLNKKMQLKANENIYFAGQITGVEGYTESAASGIYVGEQIVRLFKNKNALELPKETMLGALINYITDESVVNFQPMGSNMGILPSMDVKIKDKALRYETIAKRGLELFPKDDINCVDN